MKTSRGIYLDIQQSTYYCTYYNKRFYFTSKYYLEKFRDNVDSYIELEALKLKTKYRVDWDFTLFLTYAFYKKVETRGYRVE